MASQITRIASKYFGISDNLGIISESYGQHRLVNKLLWRFWAFGFCRRFGGAKRARIVPLPERRLQPAVSQLGEGFAFDGLKVVATHMAI